MPTIQFKSTVEELSTFPVIDHFWHETSAFTKRFEPSDHWCLKWREPWSGAMVRSYGPASCSPGWNSGNDAGDLKCNDSKSEFEEFALH